MKKQIQKDNAEKQIKRLRTIIYIMTAIILFGWIANILQAGLNKPVNPQNCTVIGYMVDPTNTVEKCMANCANQLEYCANELNQNDPMCMEPCNLSAAECAGRVGLMRQLRKQHFVVSRCPAATHRQWSDFILNRSDWCTKVLDNYVDNHGNPLDIDAIKADTENVYIINTNSLTSDFKTQYVGKMMFIPGLPACKKI